MGKVGKKDKLGEKQGKMRKNRSNVEEWGKMGVNREKWGKTGENAVKQGEMQTNW